MKKVMFCATIYLLIVTGVASSQPEVEWSTVYQREVDGVVNALIQTRDGGFAMAGYSIADSLYNFRLLRASEGGELTWARSYGRERIRYGAKALVETHDEGFVMAGRTIERGAGSGDFYLVKVDQHGDLLWSKTYGGGSDEECQSMLVTEDGGLILVGYTASFGKGNVDGWIVRTDADGDSLWSRTFGGEAYDCFNSVVRTTDGNYVAAGGSKSYDSGAGDFWLVKFRDNGDSLWSRTYGTEFENLCHDVVKTDQGFAMAGTTRRTGRGNMLHQIIQVNSSGDSLWSVTTGVFYPPSHISIITTADRGLAMLGHIANEASDVWLLKIDENGDSVWSASYGSNGIDFAFDLIQTANDNFVIAGLIQPEAHARGLWLAKTTPDNLFVPTPTTHEPTTFSLLPAYPNPFNSTVTIPFAVGAHRDAPLQLAIFDPLGRRVTELFGSTAVTGGQFHPAAEGGATTHSVVWNANGMPAGLYSVRLQAPGVTLSQPLVLTK